MDKKYYAIITAGGSGARMGGKISKQFQEIGGKPILVHTINNFLSLSVKPEIILVLPEGLRDYWNRYCLENNLVFRHTAVNGGITRFHSVKNALKYVKKGGIVAIHDGVRPFATPQFIEQMYSLGERFPAVIPVVKTPDSVRRVVDGENYIVNREELVLVQTPQIFDSTVLLDAYNCAYKPGFTDDASVVEAAGTKITIADGLKTNIKITEPMDLVIAEAILNASSQMSV